MTLNLIIFSIPSLDVQNSRLFGSATDGGEISSKPHLNSGQAIPMNATILGHSNSNTGSGSRWFQGTVILHLTVLSELARHPLFLLPEPKILEKSAALTQLSHQFFLKYFDVKTQPSSCSG